MFVHDLVPLERTETAGRYTRWLGSHFLRSAIRRADVVLVATEKLASAVSALGGATFVWRPEIPNDLQLAFHRRHREPYILSIGTVEPRKNVSSLVAIAKALSALGSPVKVKLAGKLGWGPPPPRQAPNFEYLGYVERTALRSLIEGASMLVSTSSYEGLGLPILEVGHAGLPCAVFRSAIPEEVLPSPAICLEGDAVTDAARIHRFVHDTADAEAHREAAFRNTARWNQEAAASRRDLLTLLRSFR